MRNKLLILGLAALSAASCQTDGSLGFNDDPEAVRINATLGGVFNATTDGASVRSNPTATDETSKAFNESDAIKVFTADQSDVTYTLNKDGKWMPSGTTYLKWTAKKMTFTAVYPATATAKTFNLPSPQGNLADIAKADYMFGSKECTYGGSEPISIPLDRKTARVIVEINEFDGQYSENEKKVTNVTINSAASGYKEGSASIGVTKITPFPGGTLGGVVGSTYTALVIPTKANASANFVELTDGKGRSAAVEGIPELEPGKSYLFKLKVNYNMVVISSVQVSAWGSDITIPGGDIGFEIEYMSIPATNPTFKMGSPESYTAASINEKPEHSVTLSAFRMSKCEITNAQYCSFLNANGIGADGKWTKTGKVYSDQVLVKSSDSDLSSDWGVNWKVDKWVPATNKDDFPVILVSWFGAKAFAEWVGGDLPTEAQWEYACRAGTTTPWATKNSDGSDLKDYAWYSSNSEEKTHAVGTTTHPNDFGLYDMHGNVIEWCNDWYGVDYYEDPKAKGPDPTGPSENGFHVVRGGYYDGDALSCRSAYRDGFLPDDKFVLTGFRVVVSY